MHRVVVGLTIIPWWCVVKWVRDRRKVEGSGVPAFVSR